MGHKSGHITPTNKDLKPPDVKIIVNNISGYPIEAENTDVRFDGQQFVIETVVDKIVNSRGFRQTMTQGMMGR